MIPADRAKLLPARVLATLDALAIMARPVSQDSMTMEWAQVEASAIAKSDGVHMLAGWQENDVTGEREAGYAPLASVSAGWLYLEPVTLHEPPR